MTPSEEVSHLFKMYNMAFFVDKPFVLSFHLRASCSIKLGLSFVVMNSTMKSVKGLCLNCNPRGNTLC